MTGQIFGKLTVVSYTTQYRLIKKTNGTKVWNGAWLCTCECGNEVYKKVSELNSGMAKSCGCIKAIKDISGQVFGKLTVQKRVRNTKTGKSVWECLCVCGNTINIVADKLKSGRQVSCGCSRGKTNVAFRKEKQAAYYNKYRETFFTHITELSLQNGLKLLSTLDEFKTFRRKQQTSLRFSCAAKGHEFELAWFNMQQQLNCRVCNGFRSKDEIAIYEWLQTVYSGPIEPNYKKILGTHEVDIFIPEKKIAIDFNGLFTHSELCREKDYHIEKLKAINQQGIKFYQINADEWHFKQDIVKSLLCNKLGLGTKRYFARKLSVQNIPKQQAQEFLRDNHLMGEHVGSTSIGLVTENNELVCLLTYQNRKSFIDISRFCTALGTIAVGGFSKLINYIEQHIKPKRIQSYVDLRYGTGESLLTCGFRLEKITLGWKWTDYRHTFNRMACRANMDERNLTEREYAKELKWVRIYDSGQALFVKDIL